MITRALSNIHSLKCLKGGAWLHPSEGLAEHVICVTSIQREVALGKIAAHGITITAMEDSPESASCCRPSFPIDRVVLRSRLPSTIRLCPPS